MNGDCAFFTINIADEGWHVRNKCFLSICFDNAHIAIGAKCFLNTGDSTKQMSFFINDLHAFQLTDIVAPILQGGALAVFHIQTALLVYFDIIDILEAFKGNKRKAFVHTVGFYFQRLVLSLVKQIDRIARCIAFLIKV